MEARLGFASGFPITLGTSRKPSTGKCVCWSSIHSTRLWSNPSRTTSRSWTRALCMLSSSSSSSSIDMNNDKDEGSILAAASKTAAMPGEGAQTETSQSQMVKQFFKAFYKFTRPHTIRGTILGAFAGCVRALIDTRAPIKWALVPRAALGVVALLAANAFIVGINQIYDVNIDKINKPFLPMAAGDMSAKTAWITIMVCLVVGIAIVYTTFSPLISVLYTFGILLGVLYSVPPFRWKNNPLLAALSISCARGFLLNFGVYHATMAALGLSFVWSPPIAFLAVFMMVFALVIALSKDLPDIEGDRKFQVNTFASRLGPARLSTFVTGLLFTNYIYACLFALFSGPGAVRKPIMIIGHLLLAAKLVQEQRKLNPSDNGSIKEFYKGIWALFYSEYALFLMI